MSHVASILVVEDDIAIATGLALNLRIEGYSAEVAHDGEQALVAVAEHKPDLILLDLSLPKKDGLTFLSELRAAGNPTPVVVLSAREGEYDKVGALRLGADDYVTKPFALAELMARIAAVLRRVGPTTGATVPPTAERLGFDDVEVDLATRTVSRSGNEVKLTHLEFELLLFFLRNPSRVLPRELLRLPLRPVAGGRNATRRAANRTACRRTSR
jgi:DNA-binding response OmpR family regulator